MSTLYEALKRAVGARRSDKKVGRGASNHKEDSSAAGSKQVSSILANSSGTSSKEPSPKAVSSVEDVRPPSRKLVGQVVASNPKLSTGMNPPNGFRRLTLPLQVESRLVFHTDPHGLAAEQFRVLRQALNREFEKSAVLMITSPAMGDGKTLTSLNLSNCLGAFGDPTLLVELDFRRPAAQKTLGCVTMSPGVEDVLAGKAEPCEAIHSIKELAFHAAMVANIPDDPSQLLNGIGVKQLLTWAREHFRWVVVDAPPVLPAADVAELMPFADAVLLVIRARSTPKELSRRSFEILGKHLHAVILNEATIESNPHYRYLRGYNQGSAAKIQPNKR